MTENIKFLSEVIITKFVVMIKDISDQMTYSCLKKILGIAYLGKTNQSAKMHKSYINGVNTYCLYLAPWNLARTLSRLSNIPNVCAGGKYCHEHCLNGSGQNRPDQMVRSMWSKINISRVKRTLLLFLNCPVFMKMLIHEINSAMRFSKKHNMDFAVRLNGTSDISPELFIDPKTGLNVLKLYPNVQFYDYTKIPSRIKLARKYDNYFVTFSYDGHNWDVCKKYLDEGGQVAVVFFGHMPKRFNGYKVVSGDNYDMRYLDPRGVIIGLTYHKTANDYKNGHFEAPKCDFVVDVSEIVKVNKIL